MNIYLRVSLLILLSTECVFVCVCDNSSEGYQKPCHLCQTYSKLDAMLHKIHSKMLLVLRYQGSTSGGLSNLKVKQRIREVEKKLIINIGGSS